jgi:hypothetical protein
MRCFFALLLLISINELKAQRFTTNVDRTEITLDQYLQVEFTLENAQGKNFATPDLKGWTVIQGPSTSSSVSIINGARSSTISYGYLLSPRSVGLLTIGKAEITVGNKTLYTDPITIKVTKASPQAQISGHDVKALSKKDIFITAKATPEKAYVGQQVLIEYKLFTVVNVENYNILRNPEFKGFHSNNIPRLSNDSREIVNGRTYVTKVIHAASIYPIQNGKFEIDPLHVRASVVVDDGRSNPNSFFLLPTTEGVNLVSNSIEIEILPLPQPIPPNFSGAVGRYTMTSRIDQLNVKMNDAISITSYIEGDGDLNRVSKPFLNLDSNSFQLYEPKITKENTDYKLSGFIGMRELIYPVVATKPGMHKIVPSFVYFNPDSQKYITLAPEAFNLNVSGGTKSGNKDVAQQHKEEILEELKLIKNPRLSSNHFIGTSLYFLCLSLPLIGWLAVYVIKKRKEQYNFVNKDQLHLQTLKKNYLSKLDEYLANANPLTKTEADQSFDILQHFLKAHLKINDASYSKNEWLTKINSSDSIREEVKTKIKEVFNTAEMALYAGQMSTIQVHEMIVKTKEIISSI